MMAIADIYDALTATDRPYKKAVRADDALDILDAERRAGALDGALLDLFIEARVFERHRSTERVVTLRGRAAAATAPASPQTARPDCAGSRPRIVPADARRPDVERLSRSASAPAALPLGTRRFGRP